ncbi:MAG: HD domain-containing protein [candidate division Zixibacteria bacterium]|nr:HD domain-containing protein [candidate division Zixibacteria bacterium]
MREQNVNENGEYLPISIKSISIDSVYQFDLYQKNNGSFRLFRCQNIPVLQKDFDNLIEYGQEILYVPSEQKEPFYDHMINNLPNLLQDKSVLIEEKIDILTSTSVSILDRILTEPMSKANIKNSVDHSNNHVYMALHKESSRHLMTMDYSKISYPIAHAINVANMSILLGIRCGITNPEKLQNICIGALLHEIGKRIIDENYYFRKNDNFRITNTRFKKYPIIGKNMLEKTGVVPSGALRPVLEHQERLDGTGYPFGLKAGEIGIEGRIIAICDCYDEALRTNKLKLNHKPFKILLKMKASIIKFDKKIFVEFVHLLGTDIASKAIKI